MFNFGQASEVAEMVALSLAIRIRIQISVEPFPYTDCLYSVRNGKSPDKSEMTLRVRLAKFVS